MLANTGRGVPDQSSCQPNLPIRTSAHARIAAAPVRNPHQPAVPIVYPKWVERVNSPRTSGTMNARTTKAQATVNRRTLRGCLRFDHEVVILDCASPVPGTSSRCVARRMPVPEREKISVCELVLGLQRSPQDVRPAGCQDRPVLGLPGSSPVARDREKPWEVLNRLASSATADWAGVGESLGLTSTCRLRVRGQVARHSTCRRSAPNRRSEDFTEHRAGRAFVDYRCRRAQRDPRGDDFPFRRRRR